MLNSIFLIVFLAFVNSVRCWTLFVVGLCVLCVQHNNNNNNDNNNLFKFCQQLVTGYLQ